MNKIKNKLPVLIFFSVSVCAYLWAIIMWGKCPTVDCSEQFIDNWLRTIKVGAVSLILFSGVFLLLPINYFIKWCKHIFSWAFPVVVYLTYITTGSNSIPAYGKVDVVKFWALFFIVVTFIYILIQKFYFKTK